MIKVLYRWYAYVFGGSRFIKLNKFLYQLSLRGLGVLNYENNYLTGERYWLKRYLKNKHNPIIIDVGANVGKFSMDVFEVNSTSRVYSFEPHPVNFEKLIKNIKSDRFKAFNLAVGEKRGSFKLYDYSDKDGSPHASLYKEVIVGLHRGTAIEHDVDVVALDEFLQEILMLEDIELLKIDTEGNELSALLGARWLIESKKIKAIHFEFNEMNIVSKASFKDFWDLLNNYRIYRILAGGGLLEIKNYSPIGCEIYAFQNIIAILK